MKKLTIEQQNLISLLIIIINIFIYLGAIPYYLVYSYSSTKNRFADNFKTRIEELYNIRSKAFISGDLLCLKPLFDTTQMNGKWAFEHEVKRAKYLSNWAELRNIKFINAESSVRIKNVYNKGNIRKFYLEETYKFDYIYKNSVPHTINSFGIGIRHFLSLVNRNDTWVICSDWYTDCFQDAIASYTPTLTVREDTTSEASDDVFSYKHSLKSFSLYDRKKAVEYADKYCGAAYGEGNNFRYNKKYPDFNGIGGDCTNFVSQILTDKEGGKMKKDNGLYPGTRAWSNVDGLKDYILNSHKGYIIGKGKFESFTKNSTVSKVSLGDLVCYVKKGNPDHFAVITGFDSQGYPLVNSHTTDRYHVPWDLGWGDRGITFILIHING